MAILAQNVQGQSEGPAYREMELQGWKVRIREELDREHAKPLSKALELLEKQLAEITRVVPGPALEKLRSVTLWLSPTYPGEQARAEYHPGAGWLVEHHRDPKMERGVEFTNILIFEEETRRMPNFALHELAHAYHHQFLAQGFSNPEVEKAYSNAKKQGDYERVEQRFADGSSKITKAYGMNNPAEYFAESSEAFFSTNDFYPFTRDELKRHDPEMEKLLRKLWGVQEP